MHVDLISYAIIKNFILSRKQTQRITNLSQIGL